MLDHADRAEIGSGVYAPLLVTILSHSSTNDDQRFLLIMKTVLAV